MTSPELPAGMHAERNILITLSDGVELASDLYLPDGDGPFPTLISFYPYRKDDIIGSDFEHPRRELVSHGYAHLLVDLRGYGGSAGVSVESFHPRPEGKDGAEVVTWAAAQPWSTGDVGVWGVSYGGTLAFAVGVEAPPALKAIVPVYAMVDLWDDILAHGDVPIGLGMFQREAVMLAQELSPPAFQDPEGRWARVWEDRMSRVLERGPSSFDWLANAGDEAYWAERTVEIEKVQTPTFLVTGWRDLFPDGMAKSYARTPGIRRMLAGPWTHVVPDRGPEPFDWIGEMVTFFDHHLKGEGGPAETDGATYFLQGSESSWRHAPAWPPPGVSMIALHPGTGNSLVETAAASGTDTYRTVATVGVHAGLFDALALGIGYPDDQSEDDRRSLSYTGEKLTSELIITGSPTVDLDLGIDADQPVDLAVKLVDVGPDGYATLITTGWRRVLKSGVIHVDLASTAYRVSPGHRLRMSIAGSDFPRMQPLPAHRNLTIALAGSTLIIPVSTDEQAGRVIEPKRPPVIDEPAPWFVTGGPVWKVIRDEVSGSVSVTTGGGQELLTPTGIRFTISFLATASVNDDHPDALSLVAEAGIDMHFPAGDHIVVRTDAVSRRGGQTFTAHVTHDGHDRVKHTWRSA